MCQVCGDSAKVQLNSGILQRRYQNWDAAIEHFYCEPGYWIGLCMVNRGDRPERGIGVG